MAKKFSVVILCSKSCFKHKHTTGAEYQVLKLKMKYNYNFFFIVFLVGFPKIVPLLLIIIRWIFHKFSSNLYEKLSHESQILILIRFWFWLFFSWDITVWSILSLGHIVSRESSKNSSSLRSTNKPT